MTIELSPELERIIQEAVISGQYPCAADVLADAMAVWLTQQEQGTPAATEQRRDATERLKTFGKTHGLSLGGMTIRELRDEARPSPKLCGNAGPVSLHPSCASSDGGASFRAAGILGNMDRDLA